MLPASGPGRSSLRRVGRLRAVLCAMALTVVGSAASHAQDRSGFEAKIEYCKTCHGLSAQGYRGWFPMPRLAGQQPQYLENQLRAFLEHRRTNPVMANAAHGLSSAMIASLATHLKNLDPKPIGGAPRGSLAVGKRIYEEGLPDSNVPACAACHGSDGKGQNEIPRLAGQLYEYTVGQLAGWTKTRGSATDTSAIMAPTSHNLARSQVEAVAAYVSYMQ